MPEPTVRARSPPRRFHGVGTRAGLLYEKRTATTFALFRALTHYCSKPTVVGISCPHLLTTCSKVRWSAEVLLVVFDKSVGISHASRVSTGSRWTILVFAPFTKIKTHTPRCRKTINRSTWHLKRVVQAASTTSKHTVNNSSTGCTRNTTEMTDQGVLCL